MKTVFRKLFKTILALALFGACLVVGAALILLSRPQILINERNVLWAATQLRREGTDLHWDAMQVAIASPSLLRKRLGLAFQGLCVTTSGGAYHACFTKVNFAAEASFAHLAPRILELGPIELLGGRVSANPALAPAPPETPKKKSTDRAANDFLPSFLRGTRIHPSHVEIISWRLQNSDSSIDVGSLDLTAVAGEGNSFKIVSDLTARALGKAKMSAGLHLDGRVFAEGFEAKLNGFANGLNANVSEIKLNDCAMKLVRTPRRASAGNFTAVCPFVVKLPVPPQDVPDFKIPAYAGIRLALDVNTGAFPPSATAPLDGRIRIAVDPILSPLFRGEGKIDTELSGIAAEFPQNWKLDSEVALSVRVADFQKLVQALADTKWAVPAPLHVLKGSGELAANGKIDLSKGELPVSFVTRLASEKQRLDVDASGVVHLTKLKPAPHAKLDLDVVLSNVELELPRFELGSPPQMAPDARISAKDPARAPAMAKPDASPNGFVYDVQVHTMNQPIRLLANLAKAPVPINVDLRLGSEAPLGGAIRVAAFPVNLFRRDASVDHFNVVLKNPTKESTLDGSLKVAYADYTIYIDVVSTMGKPQINLRSEPPLPENQIVSALLFGKPLDQLDPEQSESVGNTRGALADGALGLGSMYALASTPVESVGYDSKTGTVTAKVRLGSGMSLNVGTSNEQRLRDLGIRKRLGPKWTIETDLAHPTDAEGRVASAFLQWNNRY